MLSASIVEVIIILVLILANGFFAASEIAVVSSRRGRLEQAAEAGRGGAKQALDLSQRQDRFLATVQVGITLIGTFASAFGGARLSGALGQWIGQVPALNAYADEIAFTLVVVLITYVSLVLGELVPKRLALNAPERIAVLAAPVMLGLSRLAAPVIGLLTFSVNVVLRLLRQTTGTAAVVTEEDILHLTRQGATVGTVENEEVQLIQRIFRFSDRLVRNVMTPRTAIVAVELDTPLDEILDVFLESGYSRLPVYEGSLDNIVGVLYAKDFLRARRQFKGSLRQYLHPPTFVLPHQHVNDILSTFRQKGTHMGLVVDEYGQIDGLVTLEDVLEELVGEIRDEYDIAEDVDEGTIVRRTDGSFLADGILPYETVSERTGLPPEPEGRHVYATLAGFILHHLQRIPREGDTVEIPGYTLEVVDMDGRRIDKVLIRPAAPTSPSPAE